MQREMTAAARTHRSAPGALLTVFGLGTAAVAGAAIALAVSAPPRSTRRRSSAKRRSATVLDGGFAQEADGAALFV